MEIRPTCTYPIFLEDVTVNRHIFFVGLSSIETSNLQKLDWYISTKHVYVSDEHNIWKSPLGNYKKKMIINIYHLLIFNKLLTSSEHRNRNKPFYIYKGLIQWQGRSSVLPMTNVHVHAWEQCHSYTEVIKGRCLKDI